MKGSYCTISVQTSYYPYIRLDRLRNSTVNLRNCRWPIWDPNLLSPEYKTWAFPLFSACKFFARICLCRHVKM